MISYAKIMRQVLNERRSFNDLLAQSDVERAKRADHVRSKSLRVKSIDEQEAWTFSYKSEGIHSTTGDRHQGMIRFFKEDVSSKEDASELECMVDCSCPDYRYRWAYNNAKAGAGQTGGSTLNQSNGAPPQPRPRGVGDLGEGLCKHLISLGEYLETTTQAPDPEQKVVPKVQVPPAKPVPSAAPKPTAAPMPKPSVAPKPAVKVPTLPKPSTTINAPRPEDEKDKENPGYSDTRSGLEEQQRSGLYTRMENLVRATPEFEVMYYDED